MVPPTTDRIPLDTQTARKKWIKTLVQGAPLPSSTPTALWFTGISTVLPPPPSQGVCHDHSWGSWESESQWGLPAAEQWRNSVAGIGAPGAWSEAQSSCSHNSHHCASCNLSLNPLLQLLLCHTQCQEFQFFQEKQTQVATCAFMWPKEAGT